MQKQIISITTLLFLIILSTFGCVQNEATTQPSNLEKTTDGEKQTNHKPFKVLHVMSYHTPWEWTESQLQGFKDALDGVNIEYKVFELDTKNFSSEDQKLNKAKQAMELIDEWDPDLLFTSDEDAQKYVAFHYAGTDLPIVFSAVNKDPHEYGFDHVNNVTGVLEHEHFIESINLLKELDPNVQDIAVIFDNDPMWQPTIERMKKDLPSINKVTFTSWDFIDSYEEYKKRIIELQTEVDAIALIGIFTFKDENGQNVHYRDVLKWTAENSQLPDFSFWKDRSTYGTLAVVSISGYEQGHEAGLLAKQILVEGKTPSELPIRTSMIGEPLINKARADDLGIKIRSKAILASEVIANYGWVTENE